MLLQLLFNHDTEVKTIDRSHNPAYTGLVFHRGVLPGAVQTTAAMMLFQSIDISPFVCHSYDVCSIADIIGIILMARLDNPLLLQLRCLLLFYSQLLQQFRCVLS